MVQVMVCGLLSVYRKTYAKCVKSGAKGVAKRLMVVRFEWPSYNEMCRFKTNKPVEYTSVFGRVVVHRHILMGRTANMCYQSGFGILDLIKPLHAP